MPQHIPAILLILLLLGSLATLALTFGVVVWAMRYRSAGLVLLLGMPLCLVTSIVAFFQDSTWLEWLFYTGLAAFGCAIVGLWLARRAYRLWLETELG